MSLYYDHDDLDALDFFVAEEVCEDGAESDALDGFATDDPTHPVPDIDAMDQFMPGEVEDEDTEPDTAPLQIEEPHGAAETAGAEEGVDSNGAPLFTVVNPPWDGVGVGADGRPDPSSHSVGKGDQHE